ncbi:MAG: hypothetical protein KC433_15890 [Anaerolineales bacterium]|nr:hypothetical protein [Anaerolineales bacterium]MCB8940120.1 hypothetical protein [Ardenticatenaceae bacterium]
MSETLLISFVFAVPTLMPNGRFQLTVGLQLSNGQQFWADCVDAPAASRGGETAVFDPSQATETVKTVVRPLWQGQPAAEFRPLAQKLLPLSETFRYTKIIPPKPEPITGAISRRSLITGFLAEEEVATPKQEQVTVERPLHPALQYGLTAALLPAVAAVNRVTVAALLAREYGLDWGETAVPLQIPLNDENIQAAHSILASQVASLGHTTGNTNLKANLGANGERLQQHVRQIAAWLPSLNPEYAPKLHLDLRGGFGELFEQNSGKILGAIYGLEQAGKPYELRIQNPVWREDAAAQRSQLKELSSFCRARRLKAQLVADAWVDSLAAVQQFADASICQMIHIELPRLGNLEVGITAVQYAHTQNHPVILSGSDTSLTTHIALATRPGLLHGSPLTHYNEMQKFLHSN